MLLFGGKSNRDLTDDEQDNKSQHEQPLLEEPNAGNEKEDHNEDKIGNSEEGSAISEMCSSSDDMDSDSDASNALSDIEYKSGVDLHVQLVSACYSDLVEKTSKLSLFQDYQSEIESMAKNSKKCIEKLVVVDSLEEIDTIADVMAVEDELAHEILYIKALLMRVLKK